MRTIGLIGGMSWESTLIYYRHINELVKLRLGGLHSARILLHSVDFHEIEQFQHAGDWQAAGELLAVAARSLETAVADFLLICTNTMHKVAPAVEAAISIPLLHIADATAARIKQSGVRKVGLLGTRFTMEEDFYRGLSHGDRPFTGARCRRYYFGLHGNWHAGDCAGLAAAAIRHHGNPRGQRGGFCVTGIKNEFANSCGKAG
jgi:hypothetical protein